MARRKKDTSLRDLLVGLFNLSWIVAFFIGFNMNHSFTGGFVLSGIILGIGFVIFRYLRFLGDEKLRRSGISVIDQMDGRQFEFYLEQLFKNQGYSVEVTRAAGDYGADLILKKDGRKISVQAKRHKKNVGIEAVQQVRGSMDTYNCPEGWVVTNSHFTKQAYEQAKASNVCLIDRDELISMILKMNPGAAPNPKKVLSEVDRQPVKCKCGQPMKIRSGPKGDFWGCSTFPSCRNIKPL